MLSVIHCVIIFMFIFSFKIPIFYNSSFLAFFISLFLLRKKNLSNFLFLLKNKRLILLISIYCIAVLWGILNGAIQYSQDYSYIPIFLGAIVYLFMAAFITSIIVGNKEYIFSLITYVFMSQSIIILISFLSPSFHNIIVTFQVPTQVDIAETYYGGGVRGLALSGGQFFNLSALYSLLILTLFLAHKNIIGVKISLLTILFIFLTSLTTGRTTLIGFAIGLLTVLIIKNRQVEMIKKIFIISIILISIFYILPNEIIPPNLKKPFESYSKFAFEFIHNYLEKGKIYTTSTDTLKNMYFLPELKTIIFGDGIYTNSDGSYYRHTDSGFMRNILLFGIFGLAAFMFYTLYQVYYYCFTLFDKNKKIIFLSTSILLLLLQYKGEVFGYLYTVNLFINILFFYSILLKKDTNKINQ